MFGTLLFLVLAILLGKQIYDRIKDETYKNIVNGKLIFCRDVIAFIILVSIVFM